MNRMQRTGRFRVIWCITSNCGELIGNDSKVMTSWSYHDLPWQKETLCLTADVSQTGTWQYSPRRWGSWYTKECSPSILFGDLFAATKSIWTGKRCLSEKPASRNSSYDHRQDWAPESVILFVCLKGWDIPTCDSKLLVIRPTGGDRNLYFNPF